MSTSHKTTPLVPTLRVFCIYNNITATVLAFVGDQTFSIVLGIFLIISSLTNGILTIHHFRPKRIKLPLIINDSHDETQPLTTEEAIDNAMKKPRKDPRVLVAMVDLTMAFLILVLTVLNFVFARRNRLSVILTGVLALFTFMIHFTLTAMGSKSIISVLRHRRALRRLRRLQKRAAVANISNQNQICAACHASFHPTPITTSNCTGSGALTPSPPYSDIPADFVDDDEFTGRDMPRSPPAYAIQLGRGQIVLEGDLGSNLVGEEQYENGDGYRRGSGCGSDKSAESAKVLKKTSETKEQQNWL